MKIEKLMGVALAATSGFYNCPLAAQTKARIRPNIILIMTDQHRRDAVGCYGNKEIITPNLDRLANEGYRFSHAYTSSPSSTPARAGLLTGMSPWHHGLLGYGQMAEKYPVEGPEILRQAGYHTAAIGKMHWFPQHSAHGYESLLVDESGRVESPHFVSDYRRWFKNHAFGLNPDSTGIKWNAHKGKPYALPENLHPTRWTCDKAIELLQGYQSDKPLFLKVSFARPHSPYDPPRRVLDKYEGKSMPGAVVGKWCESIDLNPHPEKDPEAYKGNFGKEYVSNSKLHYYAAITFIDEQVGRIVQELKDKGMYDNSLIIFVSDHGDMMGDHNLWRKTYAYEGSAGIPFIVKLPADWNTSLSPGSALDQPVELRDVLPTFLEAAGREAPAEIDGMSILPLIKSGSKEWRKYIDLEHATAYWKDNYWVALTDGNIKYIRFLRTGQEQLFDLKNDPDELNDLAGAKKMSRTLDMMRREMAAHLSERGEEWVRNGEIQIRDKNLLYSPNYPKKKQK